MLRTALADMALQKKALKPKPPPKASTLNPEAQHYMKSKDETFGQQAQCNPAMSSASGV